VARRRLASLGLIPPQAQPIEQERAIYERSD
jgi:hypothetical protein